MTKLIEILASRIVGPFCPAIMGRPETYYQTAEHKAGHVATKYKAWRKRGLGASAAFAKALAAPAIHQRGFADGYATSASLGAPWGSGSSKVQWAETPAALGFRFAGYADEIAPRTLRYTGWYNRHDSEGSTLRGAVWRLPHGRLVPGFVEMEGDKPMNGESGALALGDMMHEEPGGEDEDTLRDCAMRADSIAQYEAEAERENDSAYQAGAKAARRMGRAAEARREAMELLAEMKAAGRKGRQQAGAICAALRTALDDKLATIRTAREKRERDWSDCPSRLELVWIDGYREEASLDGWKSAARALGLPASE